MTKPLTSIKTIQVIDPLQLTRGQRLERWAAALERLGNAPLNTLRETEHQPYFERMRLRQDNSPLTVAFDEPVLQSAGLRDDTFGEAARFFDLSDWELHNVLCYCHFGQTVAASEVAARVRAMQRQVESIPRMVAQKYAFGIAAITCGLGFALLLAV